jgi:hypothetical protein
LALRLTPQRRRHQARAPRREAKVIIDAATEFFLLRTRNRPEKSGAVFSTSQRNGKPGGPAPPWRQPAVPGGISLMTSA